MSHRRTKTAKLTLIDTTKRVAIIYDHLILKKSVKQIIDEYDVNYSTVRHILMQYYLFGRTDIRKFRLDKCQFDAVDSIDSK